MQLSSLAALAIALTLLALADAGPGGAGGGGRKIKVNPWTSHRAQMEWWILWPKQDDRDLKLKTLPACIRDCITPEDTVFVHHEEVSVHAVKRREFCDPRLNLVKKYFVKKVGACSLEACRFEHSLWRLRRHYHVWLQGLCIPPGIKKPTNVWRLYPDLKMKPMIDPSANITDLDVLSEYGAAEDVDLDKDDYSWGAYEDLDSDAYRALFWGTYEDFGWDFDEDFEREAKTIDEADVTNATQHGLLGRE
ncbi:hypothetical protein LX36DRAFT_442581 [Colletotrichum falcatum]|nr:hypothetical protein LX36DRAFT_442581 [Colletotrichum falcatum]